MIKITIAGPANDAPMSVASKIMTLLQYDRRSVRMYEAKNEPDPLPTDANVIIIHKTTET